MKKNGLTMLKLILIALTLSHQMSGCKPKQVLPEPTQEGLNTFGVKIDGKVWLPKMELSLLGGSRLVHASIHQGVLGIEARKGFSDEAIILVVPNVKSIGIYKLKEDDSGGTRGTTYEGDLVNDDYLLLPGGTNQINITRLDTAARIISGTFSAQFKGKNKQAIKNFTNGTFDIKL